MNSAIFTIGHSNHQIEYFISLLQQHGISALADVRSHPFSRYFSHFSRDSLKAALSSVGIAYVFLGKELGARSLNPACYRNGKVQYDRLATEPLFLDGIKRLNEGMERYKVSLMCAEKDPVDCHRALLVARKLFEMGASVYHIHADGAIEEHQIMESRLLSLCGLPEGDMFKSRDEFVRDAYRIQAERVAYQDESMAKDEGVVTS